MTTFKKSMIEDTGVRGRSARTYRLYLTSIRWNPFPILYCTLLIDATLHSTQDAKTNTKNCHAANTT